MTLEYSSSIEIFSQLKLIGGKFGQMKIVFHFPTPYTQINAFYRIY